MSLGNTLKVTMLGNKGFAQQVKFTAIDETVVSANTIDDNENWVSIERTLNPGERIVGAEIDINAAQFVIVSG